MYARTFEECKEAFIDVYFPYPEEDIRVVKYTLFCCNFTVNLKSEFRHEYRIAEESWDAPSYCCE